MLLKSSVARFDRFDKVCFAFEWRSRKWLPSREHDIRLKGDMSYGDDDGNTRVHTNTGYNGLKAHMHRPSPM